MTDHPRLFTLGLLIVAITLSAAGEVFLKKGMTAIGGIEFTVPGLWRAFTCWSVLLGFALFFSGALVWLKVLSVADLSWAYPMLALGYPLVVLSAFLFLGEPLSLQRIVGSLVILTGVYVMFHSWDEPRPLKAPPVATRQ